jgi:hypothetical protein
MFSTNSKSPKQQLDEEKTKKEQPPTSLLCKPGITTYPGGGVGLALLPGAIHSGCGPPERGRSKPSVTRASNSSTVTVEKGHASRGGTTVALSVIAERKRWSRGDEVRGFLFSNYSLRLRKPKKKASTNGRVKNHRRPLFRAYKGSGEIHPKLLPNPSRYSNSKVKRFFCSSNDSRTRNRCPRIARPVALTPWQGMRHL